MRVENDDNIPLRCKEETEAEDFMSVFEILTYINYIKRWNTSLKFKSIHYSILTKLQTYQRESFS